MDSTEADRPRGESAAGSSVSGGVSRAFDAFQRGWETVVGDEYPLPTFSPATTRDFRVKSRANRVDDVAITDMHGTSAIRTEGPLDGIEDVVRLYVVRRGSWTLGGHRDLSEQTKTVSAGGFLLRHAGQSSHFETVPDTTAKVLVLPSAMLKPLLGGRDITGPAEVAEVRLLVAHTNMLYGRPRPGGRAGRPQHSDRADQGGGQAPVR
jgi:hypothetical protein